MKKKKSKCQCVACKHGIDMLHKMEHESIIRYGWYAHIVTDDCSVPNHFNLHTHGLAELWKHKDLQCCFPFMDPNILMTVFHDIIDDIKIGKSFIADVNYPGYFGGGYLARFIEAEECGRPVLRLLIPNKDGEYKGAWYEEQLRP